MNKIEIQADVSRRIRLLRRIERMLEGPTLSDRVEFIRIQQFVDVFDADGLEQYLTSTLAQDLEILTLRQLRARAKTYQIPYYTLLNRVELIREIHEARRRNETRNSGGGSAGDTIRQNYDQADGEISKSS